MAYKSRSPRLKPNQHGIYEVMWTDRVNKDGKTTSRTRRASTGTKDVQEAEIFLAEFILEKRRLDSNKDVGDGTTVYQLCQDYMDEHVRPEKRLGRNVIDKDGREILFNHITSFFGHLTLAQLSVDTSQQIEDYCLQRTYQGRQVSDGTLRRELGFMVAAFNHSRKQNRVALVPHIPLPDEPPEKDVWLSHEEFERLLVESRRKLVRGADNKWHHKHTDKLTRCYLFCLIALETASRKGVVEELTFEQVILKSDYINYGLYTKVQSAKRKPKVPISKRLKPVLERRFEEAALLLPDVQQKLNDSLFFNSPVQLTLQNSFGYYQQIKANAGSGPITKATLKPLLDALEPVVFVLITNGNVRKSFETARNKAGLKPEVTPHTLRHTKATWMARDGVPLWDIAGVLGDSVRTIEKKYAHHSPEFLHNAVNHNWETDND